jgi:hypothetical protein
LFHDVGGDHAGEIAGAEQQHPARKRDAARRLGAFDQQGVVAGDAEAAAPGLGQPLGGQHAGGKALPDLGEGDGGSSASNRLLRVRASSKPLKLLLGVKPGGGSSPIELPGGNTGSAAGGRARARSRASRIEKRRMGEACGIGMPGEKRTPVAVARK